MTPPPIPYRSDRWITPGVVITLILAVLVGLVAVVAAAAWLTSIGRDPGPMFDFVTGALAGLTGSASLVLQLANRKTATKTERNVGTELPAIAAELANVRAGQHRMAEAVWDVADALPRPPAAQAARHAYPPTVAAHGATPAPRGE